VSHPHVAPHPSCARRSATPARQASFAATLAIVISAPLAADAQPLRLRADAVAEAQSPSPAGLVVLEGEDRLRPWVSAEGLVFTGARPDAAADVLVLAVHLREPHGYGELRVGRFVFTTGAIRPVQIDGASAIARAPWGSTVEAVGGIPVVPSFGARSYDWMTGGRIAQTVASRVTAGVSYVQQRDQGEVALEEAGADVSAVPFEWLDAGARGSYDLVSPGVADATATLGVRLDRAVRVETFGMHRSPGRLLPATSLFSVLGDIPAETAGSTVTWHAAPRLDLVATGAAEWVGGDPGGNGALRARLRLDDRGDASIGGEVRRQAVSTARWTGVRFVGTQPLGFGLRFSSELELVVPDEPAGRGTVWPWGLWALSWRSRAGWIVAAATEAASTPTRLYEVDALVRVSKSWEVP
jgi:hypothetical protein